MYAIRSYYVTQGGRIAARLRAARVGVQRGRSERHLRPAIVGNGCRSRGVARRPGELACAAERLEVRDEIARSLRRPVRRARITSYNVCYTKLLRSGAIEKRNAWLGVETAARTRISVRFRTISTKLAQAAILRDLAGLGQVTVVLPRKIRGPKRYTLRVHRSPSCRRCRARGQWSWRN